MKNKISRIILLTGLSGSGKSSALNSLEDLGFYCIDNLSPEMSIDLIKSVLNSKTNIKKIAISIDIRSMRITKNINVAVERMYDFFKKEKISNTTIFLHSSKKVLITRFNETRRLHPLADTKTSLSESIDKEKDVMQYLKEKSDLVIDSDSLTPSLLKEIISENVKKVVKPLDLLIHLQSFGFKNDIPTDSDFVFDVRCLKNPYWDKGLRNLNGKNKKIINFLDNDNLSLKMNKSITEFLNSWIPRFQKSDRNYLTISIGCTGGRHRSVYMVEMLYKQLKKKYTNILIKHRDI
tara:strand:+ start:53178 stop:54056 length:879 start_codon:yes stop_codon:yes gene_type:complete